MRVKDRVRSERIVKNVRFRIQEQIDYFGGVLPERHAIAWGGFLAALLEEGILVHQHYIELTNMLPEIPEPNPIADVFIFEPDNPLLRN